MTVIIPHYFSLLKAIVYSSDFLEPRKSEEFMETEYNYM